MQKNRLLPVFLIAIALLSGCPASPDDDDPPDNGGRLEVKTGTVTFFNESSYTVTVHLDAFTGPVLIKNLGAGQSKGVDVRTSDNYGVGSTFCIEYLYRVVDGIDLASGEVWASGIDPNIQINFVVEENKSYTKQIPQPMELEFSMAFVKILNASDMQFELRRYGTAYKQAGNKNLPVPPGKTGVYDVSSTAIGAVHDNYSVHTALSAVNMPQFIAKNSYIYSFIYSGTSVEKTGEQKIVF
jgi:hypothetical protein